MAPNWNLLPNNPLAFFGLNANFDRKDLKRAYGALIKQFRPETHPAEFQKIREAYEILENQNRYGVEQAMMSKYSSAWQATLSSETTANSKSSDVVAEVLNDFDTAIQDPTATYRRLKSKPNSPQDYFLLATLSDLIEPADSQMYLKWILTGVKAHPRDPGLLRLLAEYLSAFATPEIAFSTLITLSKLVHGDEYFQVTERLWLRLLDHVPFETWAKALNKCEGNLRFRSIRPKLAFLIVAIRRSLYLAPTTWISDKRRILEQHGSEIPSSMDDEIEQLNSIIEYYQNCRQQLKSRPIFSSIDKLIETYCRFDFDEARPRIAALCDEIARNSNALAESFPTYAEDSDSNTLMLVSWIAYNIAVESGLEYPNTEQRRIEELADAAVIDISSTINTLGKRLGRLRLMHIVLPFLVLAFGPVVIFAGFSAWPWLTLGWFILASLFFFTIARPRWLGPRADEKSRNMVLAAYEKQWRPRLFRYVQACHAPAGQCIAQLADSGDVLGEKRMVEIALSYAANDRAIQVFSRLQLFLH